MKKISKNLYDACAFYSQQQNNLSVSKIANIYGVDRHSIVKHKEDYKLYTYEYNNEYYFLTEDEKIPVKIFIENKITPTEIYRLTKTKPETLIRRMTIMGLQYERIYQKDFNRNIFHTIDTEEKAYWIGFLTADGYLNEQRNSLTLKLGAIDLNHLKKFALFMEDTEESIKQDVGGAYNKDNICYYLNYNSKELTQDLKQYNIFQGKSGKEIPCIFDNLELQKSYIRGLIDGDGCVNNGLEYVGSFEMCNYIKDYFKNFYNYKDNCQYIYPKGTIYEFNVRSKQIYNGLKYIYQNATIYLDRKYKKIMENE